MTLDNRIEAFNSLGKFLRQFSDQQSEANHHPLNEQFYNNFKELLTLVSIHNPWFTESNVKNAISAISGQLNQKQLHDWTNAYRRELDAPEKGFRVAVIMAGNIPMVGFHDLLCVLLSGNIFVGKLSSDDKLLLPYLSKILIAIEPGFKDYIEFTDGQLKTMDAVIATGSNNTARYFEYYFKKYPSIIRKNRNSVAVLSGEETATELTELGKDIFQYFGLGCRNVSKLFVPKGYKFDPFYEAIMVYQDIIHTNKYANNYDYNRTVYLMSNDPTLLDNNFLLLKESSSYSSPIGVLFYEFYETLHQLNERLEKDASEIQCIVASNTGVRNSIPFGQAQCPALADYADGMDTMKFLIELSRTSEYKPLMNKGE
jgi:hypothetical protein